MRNKLIKLLFFTLTRQHHPPPFCTQPHRWWKSSPGRLGGRPSNRRPSSGLPPRWTPASGWLPAPLGPGRRWRVWPWRGGRRWRRIETASDGGPGEKEKASVWVGVGHKRVDQTEGPAWRSEIIEAERKVFFSPPTILCNFVPSVSEIQTLKVQSLTILLFFLDKWPNFCKWLDRSCFYHLNEHNQINNQENQTEKQTLDKKSEKNVGRTFILLLASRYGARRQNCISSFSISFNFC